jgi:hypothetical protein
MTRLNQILAIEGGVSASAAEAHRKFDALMRQPDLFNGMTRTYQPLDETGEKYPAQVKQVQASVEKALAKVAGELTKAFDLTATRDVANCYARADVVVDGRTILKQAPTHHLLWLEKQCKMWEDLLLTLPTLDPTERWSAEETSGNWITGEVQTKSTSKVPQRFVKYEATKEHPAQVEVWHQDVMVGTWTVVKSSGALPPTRVEHLLTRVRDLRSAVKSAREEANLYEVEEQSYGEQLFSYLLG